jgi:O-antigen ligase
MSKSKALVLLEYVLLAVCLCVMALRVTFTEGPSMQSTTHAVNLGNSLYSLSISAGLFLCFVLWIVWSFCSKGFLYRVTGIEIGLGIFCIAALAAGLAATDKRLAITDIAVFLAPLLMALLLVQILDSQLKIKLVLIVIAALGVVSAYQCAEQFFFSNEITIEQYQQNPQTLLEPLGIEPGSFQEFLFQHRLYSRGVRGFFTTRNSAGSFALMALFAAIVLCIDKFKNFKSGSYGPKHLLACGSVAIVILFSLALTRSKGAIIGLLFAAVMFSAFLCFGNWLKAHRKVILIACLLLGVAGSCVVVWYVINHGQLPGGSSMLVRRQYWHASAKMYADHPLTGVGPGNFTHFYPHYKPAEALESVADPHNFPLSILTQYGPLGLVGFLAMIIVLLWRTISPGSVSPSEQIAQRQPPFRTLAITFLIVISTALLLIRPILMPVASTDTLDLIIYIVVTLYAAPVAVFIIGFVLLAGPMRKIRGARYKPPATYIAAAIFCMVLGVALHNLIDFAIFEPGVFTTFWAMIACLVAIDFHTKSRRHIVLKPVPFVKVLIVIAAMVTALAYFNYALVPVAKSTAKIRQANQAISVGQFDHAHKLLDEAAKDDVLSSAALSLNGRMYLYHFQLIRDNNRDLLLKARNCLQVAIERNDAAFKNFERLAEVYCSLAEISTQQEKLDWLNKAFDTVSLAIERYPGCGRLHFILAQIAEQLNKNNIAIEQYKEAVEIEDKYRDQFRQVYPEREQVVSRLGEDKYSLAIKRIKELSKESYI